MGGVYVKGIYVGAYIGLIGWKDEMWGDTRRTDDLVKLVIVKRVIDQR